MIQKWFKFTWNSNKVSILEFNTLQYWLKFNRLDIDTVVTWWISHATILKRLTFDNQFFASQK